MSKSTQIRGHIPLLRRFGCKDTTYFSYSKIFLKEKYIFFEGIGGGDVLDILEALDILEGKVWSTEPYGSRG